jgi:phosphate transport system permease protein
MTAGRAINSRRYSDHALAVLVWLSAILMAGIFLWLLVDMASQGLERLSWDFLTTEPERSGRRGGIAPILVSTLAVLTITLAVAVPLGLATAIWLSEFTRVNSRSAVAIRFSLDVLAGVPSIVYGLFGSAFFCVWLGLGYSLLAGGLTLACMVLPILIRTTEAGLAAVPDEWRQGAAALGLTRWTALRYLLLPAAAPALTAGLMLGIGRALAETAVLLFTSGYVDRMPTSWLDSGRVLAVHIFDLSMNVTGGDKAAYGSALVLLALLLLVNGLAIALSDRWLARRITQP